MPHFASIVSVITNENSRNHMLVLKMVERSIEKETVGRITAKMFPQFYFNFL